MYQDDYDPLNVEASYTLDRQSIAMKKVELPRGLGASARSFV